MFITTKVFADATGESYDLVLNLCKKSEIKSIKTDGGHYKIYKSELDKYLNKNSDFITREDYEAVVRENERLKMLVEQIKSFIKTAI